LTARTAQQIVAARSTRRRREFPEPVVRDVAQQRIAGMALSTSLAAVAALSILTALQLMVTP
jgi:hypothetical protein